MRPTRPAATTGVEVFWSCAFFWSTWRGPTDCRRGTALARVQKKDGPIDPTPAYRPFLWSALLKKKEANASKQSIILFDKKKEKGQNEKKRVVWASAGGPSLCRHKQISLAPWRVPRCDFRPLQEAQSGGLFDLAATCLFSFFFYSQKKKPPKNALLPVGRRGRAGRSDDRKEADICVGRAGCTKNLGPWLDKMEHSGKKKEETATAIANEKKKTKESAKKKGAQQKEGSLFFYVVLGWGFLWGRHD